LARYLVTGGAGFIGSATVQELVRRGERVRVLDNCRTGQRENLADVEREIEFLDQDVIDARRMASAVEDCEYVIHLAAIASVPRSIQDPVTTHQVNAQGTLNVLLAARRAGVKRVVYAASSSAYGDGPELLKRETMLPRPVSPYAATKLAGESYCFSFTQVYGLETVCLRYFNVYGPRQDPSSPYSGVLSRFIAAMLAGSAPVIFGDGEQSRDFTYVDDVVGANLKACLAPGIAGTTINIGTGERWTLNQTHELLREIIQTDVAATHGPPRAGDVRHSLADIGLARKLLGYNPSVSFVEGLRRTAAWYMQDGMGSLARCRAPELVDTGAAHH
jgi:UDP-N-acetylglucosamine/UDP-N-acetyl-alpha-D-glucosaminouronate 4-epimerase